MILFFGLMRPYKGIDTLLEAFAEVEGAELWVVGNPRMDLTDLVERSRETSRQGPLAAALHRRPRDPGDHAGR